MTRTLTAIGALALAGSLSLLGIAAAQETNQPRPAPGMADATEAAASLAQKAQPPACADQAWPYVAPECVAAPNGRSARIVRTIAIR